MVSPCQRSNPCARSDIVQNQSVSALLTISRWVIIAAPRNSCRPRAAMRVGCARDSGRLDRHEGAAYHPFAIIAARRCPSLISGVSVLPTNPYRRTIAGIFLIAAVAVISGTSTVHAIDLAPHRALYKMSLASASRGSGVAGATGSMVYSFTDICDAWASETNVKLKLIYAESGEVETNWSFASWEAKDGKSYRFRIRHTRDGSLIENFKGSVQRPKPADAATARFTSPKDKIIELPEGTMFPTRHLMELISAGEGGTPVFSRTVFDGASLDNPYEVNAIITRDKYAGTAQARSAAKIITDAGLKDMPAKHVRMAFFAAGSKKPEPEFELGVDYRADGIARSIRQDFGNFVVDLVPDEVEVLDRPSC